MARYGYASFFAVMSGGVAAGIAGVVLGALFDDTPTWARAVSGAVGVAVAVLTFLAVRRSRAERR